MLVNRAGKLLFLYYISLLTWILAKIGGGDREHKKETLQVSKNGKKKTAEMPAYLHSLTTLLELDRGKDFSGSLESIWPLYR